MFTGIITDVGTVVAIEEDRGGMRISIETSFDADTIEDGASIACSGCCLTAVDVVAGNKTVFTVDASAETLSKTVIGQWAEGTKVNLERSLKLGDELGGHMVSGHIDGIAELVSISEDGASWRMSFKVPVELSRLIASKGSVAIDGISLTVNEVSDDVFGVNIIPYTFEHTTFGIKSPGDVLNIEVDMLARYVARIIGKE